MKIGDQLPDLTLPNQDGENIRLHDFIGKSPLVIYFYPKDETPGCIREACSFRDQFEDFTEVGAKVFGVSSDSVSSHKRFSEKYRLNFQLLSDKKREAEKAFGVPRRLLGLLPGRVTYVFDIHGNLIHEFSSSLQPTRHIREAIEALKTSA
ncbi:MAG: peroxiredoxin [Bacteroidota bacterium]